MLRERDSPDNDIIRAVAREDTSVLVPGNVPFGACVQPRVTSGKSSSRPTWNLVFSRILAFSAAERSRCSRHFPLRGTASPNANEIRSNVRFVGGKIVIDEFARNRKRARNRPDDFLYRLFASFVLERWPLLPVISDSGTMGPRWISPFRTRRNFYWLQSRRMSLACLNGIESRIR